MMRCNRRTDVHKAIRTEPTRPSPSALQLQGRQERRDKAPPATATLNYGGKSVDLPRAEGHRRPDVIDIRKLYAPTDAFTYDPGFTSTATCESQITFIDGDKGVLLHRGYPIDQLAEKSTFIEVYHLLLHGELPTAVGVRRSSRTTSPCHTMLMPSSTASSRVSAGTPPRWPSWSAPSAR